MALCLALALLLSACGNGENTAATMHLVKTEGTVSVDDAKGEAVKLMENLGLFSGYALTTQAASYGWINMDDTKLAKLDAQSQVDINKADKLLELNVRSGNLFFNVTEPLETDETMNIRTSTMMVGIRGTCGWVETEGENQMRVCLLRGKVDCMVLDENSAVLTMETITAGQAALMRLENGEAFITVEEFDPQEVPAFVEEALDHPENWGLPEGTEDPEAPDEPQTSGAAAAGPRILNCTTYSGFSDKPMEYRQYTYDDQNNQVSYDLYFANEDMWEYSWSVTFIYDEQGRVQERRRTVRQFDNSIGEEVYLSVESRPDRVTLAYGSATGQYTFFYNELGQCVEERYHSGDSDSGLVYNAMTYEYDSQGKIAKAESYYTATADNPAAGVLERDRVVQDTYYIFEYEGDPGVSNSPPPLVEETPDSGTEPDSGAAPDSGAGDSLLAPYAGTYTMYPEYESYRSGYGGTTVTLNADGTVTGGAVDGRTPSNIRQESNGSIVIMYGDTMWFTLCPANGPTPSARWYDGSQVNLEFMDAGGGLAVLVYHADPSSVGTP